MPLKTTPVLPSSVMALDGASQRLLERWDNHLVSRSASLPEVPDFEAFGSLSQLERLLKVLNLVRPAQASPLRLALKAQRSRKWRKDHPESETPENRRPRQQAKLSISESDLPRARGAGRLAT